MSEICFNKNSEKIVYMPQPPVESEGMISNSENRKQASSSAFYDKRLFRFKYKFLIKV